MKATSVFGVIAALLCLSPPARAGEIELLSAAAMESGTAALGGNADQAVSADGRWIAFSSLGGNLVAGQQEPGTYPYPDVFLHDRQTGTTVLVSHAAGSSTLAANYISNRPSISADGRWVAYLSRSGAITPGQDPDPFEQVFLYDRDTGTNTLVTHSAAGPLVESEGTALDARVSADGHWVVFETTGTDLVPGLTGPPSINLFLYERATGQILLVSRAAGTTLTGANEQSRAPSLSGDGRYVAFHSRATDLIAGFSGSSFDWNAYLFDRVTGAMTLVSRSAGSATSGAAGRNAVISADGSSVAFVSFGNNLAAGQVDTNGQSDAFLFDRASGTNILVSRSSASPATSGNSEVEDDFALQISATGAYVAFVGKASNAVAGQVDSPGSSDDVFLFERATSSLTLVSRTSASPATTANYVSGAPAMSSDGRYVAFHSQATDLVAGQVDPVLFHDIFLFDRTTGTSTLVSGVNGSGQVAANAFSWYPQISDDGAVVAYPTSSKSVIAGASDFNSAPDIVLYDRAAGTSGFATRQAPGMASATAGHFSMLSSASADGRYAVLVSWAENLVPGQVDDNAEADVFLVDRVAGTTTLVSRSSASATTTANRETISAAISADGNWIVFNSIATDLVPGQVDTAGTPDIFLAERATGTVTLLSRAAGTAATAGNSGCGSWDWFDGYFPGRFAISADGRYVAFDCAASNLVAGQVDGNSWEDVFVHDRVTGQTSLVSRTPASAATVGNSTSFEPRISADGRYVAFASVATDLVAGTDVNSTFDVFLHDRQAGATLLASRAAGTAATTGNNWSGTPALSADGRHLAFASGASNLVPGQVEGLPSQDVFLFDRQTGAVELISRAAGSAATAPNGWSGDPVVSADGLIVAFSSQATNLVPGQTGPAGGVFVHDRTTRKTELISHTGASSTHSLGIGGQSVLSPDGRYVAFALGSLYVADRQDGTLERVALAETRFDTGEISTARSLPVFGTGGTIFFNSADPSLTGSDFNSNFDVFAWVPAAPAASDFHTIAPCRLLSTLQPGPAPVSGETSILDVHGACGIPETARAVALNVTVLQSTGQGRLTVHPGNLLIPGTSTLNFKANQTLANNAILPLASNGEGTLGITPFVVGGGTVHVIVDVSGYFE